MIIVLLVCLSDQIECQGVPDLRLSGPLFQKEPQGGFIFFFASTHFCLFFRFYFKERRHIITTDIC